MTDAAKKNLSNRNVYTTVSMIDLYRSPQGIKPEYLTTSHFCSRYHM